VHDGALIFVAGMGAGWSLLALLFLILE